MRIDGVSSQSYPIKRQTRKVKALSNEREDDASGDLELQDDYVPAASTPTSSRGSRSRTGNPSAAQPRLFAPSTLSRSVAAALASYLTTASFGEWDMDGAELDLYI